MNVCEALRRGWKIRFCPPLPGNEHEKDTLVLLTETTLIQADEHLSTTSCSNLQVQILGFRAWAEEGQRGI